MTAPASPDRPPRRHVPMHALALAAVLLAGCAQHGALQRPAAPVPPVWPIGAEAGAQEAAQLHWNQFFIDPRLQALIAAALEHNRDLHIAAARVLEARAQYGLTRAERSPLVTVNGAAAIQRTPESISGIDTASNTNRFDMSLSLMSFEVDFWGRLAQLSESAKASYLATEESRRAVHLSLIADVAMAYFALLQQNEAVALARDTQGLREQSLDLVQKGRDIGGTHDYDVLQASGALENARSQRFAAEHQQSLAQNRLNFLVGQIPDTLPPGLPLDQQPMTVQLAAGLPADVLLLRPDVQAAEQRLAAAHANVGAARAAFFPKVMLTAGLGLASPMLATLFNGMAWSFQPTISAPLFDGGRTRANADVAAARQVLAVAEYEKTIQTAFREVADQLSARAALASQLRAVTANRDIQQQRLAIAQARYEAGLVAYLEVLDAQRELVAAQQAVAQIRRAQLDAAAQLYKALGGGSRQLA